MQIITNHVPRDILSAWDFNGKELAKAKEQFDYIKWDAIETGEYDAHFFRYKGELFDIGEFSPTHMFDAEHPFRKWDAHQTDSFFSGLVFKYVGDFEMVIVGRYFT